MTYKFPNELYSHPNQKAWRSFSLEEDADGGAMLVPLSSNGPYQSDSLNRKLQEAKEWLAGRSFPHWSVGRINHD